MRIITVGLVIVGLYSFFLIRRVLKFWLKKASGIFLNILSLILAAMVIFCCSNIWSISAVVCLHIIVFALLTDIAALIIRKIFKRFKEDINYLRIRNIYLSGMLPLLFSAVVIAYGFLNMQFIVRTEYQVETSKNVENYKVILLTDTHYGTIQNPDILKQKMEAINEEHPDIVILGGDIVEEGTSKEMMEEIFRLAGSMETKYGVYYVYGNHDRQPYTENRSYTDEELSAAIQENHITILEDSYVEINDEIVLAGRGDARWENSSGRMSAEELLADVDREKYIIVADHQPIQSEENDAQGVDLEVSGHTHAGQIWPVGCLSELTGILNYGEYQEGRCKVIVSSGFTGWGYPLRTEGHCEYVIIHLSQSS